MKKREEVKKGENWRRGYQVGVKEGFDLGAKSMLRACGGCKKCFGKGYGTSLRFAEGREDFGSRMMRLKLPQMVFCRCSRGKQLMELWHEGECIIINHYAQKNGA